MPEHDGDGLSRRTLFLTPLLGLPFLDCGPAREESAPRMEHESLRKMHGLADVVFHTTTFTRGNLIVAEVTPHERPLDTTIRAHINTSRGPQTLTLPKLYRGESQYVFFGHDARYDVAPPTVEVEVVVPAGAVREMYDLPLNAPEFRVEKINAWELTKTTPLTAAERAAVGKENAALSRAWDWQAGKHPAFLDGGYHPPSDGECNLSSFGARRVYVHRDGREEPKSQHKGMDCKGSTSFAMASGRVVLARQPEEGPFFYTGNVVVVGHGQKLFSTYCHHDTVFVEEGQIVQAGQPLGTIGMTGRATGPHLHVQLEYATRNAGTLKLNPLSLEVLNHI